MIFIGLILRLSEAGLLRCHFSKADRVFLGSPYHIL